MSMNSVSNLQVTHFSIGLLKALDDLGAPARISNQFIDNTSDYKIRRWIQQGRDYRSVAYELVKGKEA